MKRTLLAPIVALLLLPTPARADELVASEVGGAPSMATDVVFVADGFTEAGREDYLASVRTQIARLRRGDGSFVRAHPERYSFHVLWTPSNEACPSRRGAPPRDTAFGLHRRASDGLFDSDDAKADATAARLAPDVDAVVIVARFDGEEPVSVATADLPSQGARVRMPEGMEVTILHELGHALFALGDEYGGGGALPEGERITMSFYPNLTVDPSGARFAGRVDSAVEGGGGFDTGVFHPGPDCEMRTVGTDRFCPVCQAAIDRTEAGPPGAPRASVQREGDTLTVTVAPGPGPTPTRFFIAAVAGEGAEPAADAAHARASRKTRFVASPHLRADADGVRAATLEGHQRTAKLAAPGGGRIAIAVTAANGAGRSPWTLIEVGEDGTAPTTPETPPTARSPSAPDARPPSRGFVDALDDER